MGTSKWAALAVAWIVVASATTAAAATYVSAVTSAGYFDFVYVPLAQHQAYELTVAAPGDIVSAAGELEWIGNRQAYREDGSYDFVNSQNIDILTPIDVALNGPALTSSFVSTGDHDVYWPNGNVRYQFISFDPENRHVSLYIRAHVDPALAGEYVTLTVTAVPEPATWGLMIAGLGLTGAALRRRPALA